MWNYFYIFNLLYYIINAEIYNTYDRCPTTSEELSEFQEKNIADICTVTFEPCDENEWSRLDGSCNNLKYPSYGTKHTPELRLLPPDFSEGFEPRKMQSGKDFPLARLIRQKLLDVGDGIDTVFATSTSYFIEFLTGEFVSTHDTQNYILETTYCCKPEGLSDPMCVPNFIPENDNVHRFSGHRCINMTRPKTFQTEGCASTDTVPSRINLATPHMDLTSVYYFNANASAANDHRTYEGGKLKVEVVNGISLPSDATESTTCRIKQARETGCTRFVPNSLAGTNLYTTWFWRYHNFIADKLAKINPCWNDSLLFNVTRVMNIACHNQIVFYEMLPKLLGKKNLMELGIIHNNHGHRDPYDENILPQLYNEFIYVLRWFHGTQDGLQRLYDKEGNFFGTTQMVNLSLRVQDLPYDNYMMGYTFGLYKQPAGSHEDHTIHADMADLGVGPFQQVLDILTNDLAKGRYNGNPGYAQYRDYCTNYTIKHNTSDSFKYLMSQSCIEQLFNMYGKDWNNVEMMAGIWCEDLMKGTRVTPTVYCIMVEQFKRIIASDRHLYERPNRPHAFSEEQLAQIRKMTVARLMCDAGDNVTKIQRHGFLRVGTDNEEVSCDEIPSIDFSYWTDDSCTE